MSRASNRSRLKHKNGSISLSAYSARYGKSGRSGARDISVTDLPIALGLSMSAASGVAGYGAR
jgi:hypothetical protein